MSILTVKPNKENVIALIMTFLDPVHHGDPGQTDKSNSKMYRRQLMRVPQTITGRGVTQKEIDALCQANPIPNSLLPYFETEPLTRFVATMLMKFFIVEFGAGEGEGLFSGVERYKRLEDRFQQVAMRVYNLKDFWGLVCRELRVSSVDESAGRDLMPLLSLPETFSMLVLDEMSKQTQLIRILAQQWVNEVKNSSPRYWLAIHRKEIDSKYGDASVYKTDDEIRQLALEMGYELVALESSPLSYQVEAQDKDTTVTRYMSVSLPVHSGNDIRHDLRWAMGMHMLKTLGMLPDMSQTFMGEPNPQSDSPVGKFWASLPKPIQALLENAGAIAKGASEPANAYQLSQQIKANYPGWEVFGGSTLSFIMGASNLESVSCHFFGSENSLALNEFGIEVKESVTELLDTWGLTRHAVRSDASPMPTSFETIQAGAKMLVRLQVSPFITDLGLGALVASIRTFQELSGTIGGKAARGFGRVSVESIHANDKLELCFNQYEAYLKANADKLRKGLLDGTLGTDKVLCA